MGYSPVAEPFPQMFPQTISEGCYGLWCPCKVHAQIEKLLNPNSDSSKSCWIYAGLCFSITPIGACTYHTCTTSQELHRQAGTQEFGNQSFCDAFSMHFCCPATGMVFERKLAERIQKLRTGPQRQTMFGRRVR